MYLQRILFYLSFVILANANNLVKKEIKEPKVQVETVRIIQQPKKSIPSTAQLDNSFMPVFLTTSNVKANDFTQEMLKSLATNSYQVKPSVKLSNKSNSPNKNHNLNHNKKLDKPIKSETVSPTRWSKAGSTSSNFSPVLPINLNKMHFDTTGFIPIIPKQSTRSSSNAKLIKQASKPIRPMVNAKTIPLSKQQVMAATSPKNTSKRKTLIDLNKLNKDSSILPNPSVRALKLIKSNIKSTNSNPKSIANISSSSTSKPISTAKKASNSKQTPANAKIIDNRPLQASSSSTDLSSYLSSHLSSRDARNMILKMNTLRYLAKLSPQWSASSMSETYQPTTTKIAGGLNAYPLGKITLPSDEGSYEGGYKKKPEISIELIKEILHKLTNDQVQFNKLYVMGTHRYKGQQKGNDQQYKDGQSDGDYQPENNDGYQNNNNYQTESYQDNNAGYQQDGGSYNQPENDSNTYNQPDNGGYSQPDYSQGGNYEENNNGNTYSNDAPASGNSYSNGGESYSNNNEENSYSNEGNSYNSNNEGGNSYSSNEGGNSYPANEGGNSYASNEGNGYNSNNNEDNGYNANNNNEGNGYNSNNEGNAYSTDNGNSGGYQNGGDQEQGYHLQSLGYDMSQYDNRAYVPAYSLNSLASFVHTRFKETAYKKQMGEYQFTDNPYVNNYDNYKSMDVNYAQYVPEQNMMMGGKRKKCSKNRSNAYGNSDVNFDDSYNNYGMPQMKAMVYYNNNG